MLKDKWNIIIAVELIILTVFIGIIVTRLDQPCTLSFEVHKGINFNQPYPTYRHCAPGEAAKVIE